jgi:hypothetical protein
MADLAPRTMDGPISAPAAFTLLVSFAGAVTALQIGHWFQGNLPYTWSDARRRSIVLEASPVLTALVSPAHRRH